MALPRRDGSATRGDGGSAARLGLSIDPAERPRSAQPRPPPSRRRLRPLVAGIVALGCAGGLWFAYQQFRGIPEEGSEIPIIRADKTATRIKPDNPGGDAAPEEDDGVYATGKPSTAPEHLLPPPEEPMAKPTPTTAVATSTITADAATPTPAPLAKPPPAAAPAALAQPAKPPGSAAVAPPDGGTFRVQIAATKDEAGAHTEWARLQKAHPDLLAALPLTVVSADLGDRGVFYRIQAGAFDDRATADKLCIQLKAVSIGCLVVHGH